MARDTKYRRFLQKNNIDQKDVAKGIDASASEVSQFASGYRNITITTLFKFCKFHNVTPNTLLDYEPHVNLRKRNKPPKK